MLVIWTPVFYYNINMPVRPIALTAVIYLAVINGERGRRDRDERFCFMSKAT